MGRVRQSKDVISHFGDYLLICLPLWVPIGFFLAFSVLSEGHALLFLMGLFLLGETHFAVTWLFFFDSNNWAWLKKRPVVYIWIPVLITVFFLSLSYYKSVAAAVFLASVFSAFHVTRQSIGLAKMYSSYESKVLNPALIGIYACSLYSLGVGFLRFYSDIDLSPEFLGDLRIMAVALPFLFMGYLFYVSKGQEESGKFYAVSLTGMILYGPYCLVERPEYAIAMGVGMHWLQYIALTVPLYLRKGHQGIETGKSDGLTFLTRHPSKLVIYVISYAMLMVMCRQWGIGFNTFEYSAMIMIPTCLQVLHYYFDGFIWRFSDPHIRKEIGGFLFASPKPSPSQESVPNHSSQ